MRVLILSTNTGQGHNSASRAIKDYLVGRDVDARIMDILDTRKRKNSKSISKIYDYVVNHMPFLFGGLYALGGRISSNKRHSPIYFLNALYADELYKKIKRFQPRLIVCPHMFSAHAVTNLIEKYDLTIPTVGVLTDYTCSPFWEETKLDYYIVANSTIAEECAAKGMDRKKLVPFGIPVDKRFREKNTKQEARAAFGLTKESVFAILGGSMGYGDIPKLVDALAKRFLDAQIVVVCGNNKKVFEKIKNVKNVIALKYIDNVDVLMDAADVLLTKPGGLTTTEAMTKRIPFIITKPIPGGEVRNSEFLSSTGMAISVNTVKEAVEAIHRLLTNPEERKRMIAAQETYHNRYSSEDIGEFIIRLGKKERS